MTAFLARLLRKLKHDPNYHLDPRLRAGDWLAIFFRLAGMGCYGLLWRWRFRRAQGLQFVHPRAIIRNPRYLSMGRNAVLEAGCEVQGLSIRGVTLGGHVTVGSLAMIRPSGYYGREMGEGFTIGDHSNIGPYCYVGCAGYIQIGKNVLMGPRVSLFAENHIFSDPERLIREQGVNRQGIIIEDDCWLGSGCIILDGVTIGHGSVVAAGSVVTESIPPLSVVAGVPAKVIKTRAPGAQEKKNNKP